MKKFIRSVGLLTLDIVAIWISMILAFSLRFDWSVPEVYRTQFFFLLVLMPLIRLPFFKAYGLYTELWKYASVEEVRRIAEAVLNGTIILAIAVIIGVIPIPRSIIILEGLMCSAMIGSLRFVPRLYPTPVSKVAGAQGSADTKNLLIVGAGDAGAMLLRDSLKHPEVKVVGFIDDDPVKHNKSIHGVKVLGGREKIKEAVETVDAHEIVIAMPSADRWEVRKIVESARGTGKPLKILPGLYELMDGSVTISNLREVRLEDLLGRAPIKVDLGQAGGYLKDKVILITGAGGSIGSELCRQVSKCAPKKLILLGHGENSIYEISKELKKKYSNVSIEEVIADVRDELKIDKIMDFYRPDVVYHAAAHKHVPLMEKNVDEAITNNILGTKNLVEAADRHSVDKFIFISTDKAVNPSSIMGASKRVAEVILQGMALHSETTFLAVRFGNVLGSRGSVVPLFKEQIKERKPVTITHPEMTRYFMTIPEASQLVIKAGALGKGGEIFLLDMGEPVKILDLATTLIKLMGLEPDRDVKIEFTGVRPGEKLHEELRFNDETMDRTADEKIWVLRCNMSQKDLIDFYVEVDKLIVAAVTSEADDLLKDSLMSLAKSLDMFSGVNEVASASE